MTRPIIMATVIALAGSALAQPESEPLPTLDELLGLESEGEAREDAVERELKDELEQEDAVSDPFAEAVGLMSSSASRLAEAGDTGVVTQRIQEDILRMLDQLIDQASQQGGSSSSSSSSSSSQQQQQQPSQGQQQQQAEGSQSGEPSEAGDGPAAEQARPGETTLNTAAWGALPTRLRDALLQGSADGFSSMYRSMTEEYYRRLAEETSQ